jgi:hypothetical protein
MTVAVVTKYCFAHLSNGKKYLVGAYDRDEAIEMVAQIVGDFNFIEIDIPEAYQ